jgi:hypothetical protein
MVEDFHDESVCPEGVAHGLNLLARRGEREAVLLDRR